MINEFIHVRDASDSDIPALTSIKGAGSEAVHRDRIRDAAGGNLRYLVLLAGEEIIGHACLVFRRPAHWSDAHDTQHLPQIVDLRVAEAWQGQGYGTAFLQAIEHAAACHGVDQLYLAVEPIHNPRAYALYLRLGYRPLQPQPYPKTWEFTDSTGRLHRGADLIVDMVKALPGKSPGAA